MSKTIWGYILLGIFGLVLIGAISDPDENSVSGVVGGAFMFALPGGLLLRSGREMDERVKRFAQVVNGSTALNAPLTSLEIQRKASIPAADIIKVKTIAERRGLIQYGLEIK